MDTKTNIWRAYLIRTVSMLVYEAQRADADHWISVDDQGMIKFGKSPMPLPLNSLAIKSYDSDFCGSSEERIAALCMQVVEMMNVNNVMYAVPTPLTDAEKEKGLAGDKIGAIKMIRERTRLGLKDAKDSFDYWWASKPDSHLVR